MVAQTADSSPATTATSMPSPRLPAGPGPPPRGGWPRRPGAVARASAACNRDRSTISCDQPGRGAWTRPDPLGEPAHGLRVVAASSTASASRARPPTGVFSSWLTFATKSRRTASSRRASRAVVDEQQHVIRAQRRDAGADDEPGSTSQTLGQHRSTSRITPSRRTSRAAAWSSSGWVRSCPLTSPFATTAGGSATESAESRTIPLDRSTARTSAMPSGSADRSSVAPAPAAALREAHGIHGDAQRAMPPIAPSVAAVVTSTPPG